MDIVIPSTKRADRQDSVKQLTAAGIPVSVVVPNGEYLEYVRHLGRNPLVTILETPVAIKGIADTRQYILDNVGVSDIVAMVDDDLVFSKRRTDDPTKLTTIRPTELVNAFDELRNMLTQYPHVGFASREGANRITTELAWNTRILRVLGYNRKVLKRLNVSFGRVKVMEDFDVALQLLRQGCPNVILNSYAHNQKGSGAVGGCSTYRTLQVQAQAAHDLAALHPEYVSVVQKFTKTAWGGGTRTDVKIQWKKAYAGK